MDRRCLGNQARVGALPCGHPFRLQEERKMDVHVPGLEAGDGEFSQWDFYVQYLRSQDYFMEQDPFPVPPIRCGVQTAS